MGMRLDQVVSEIGDRFVYVTLVTNQDNGIVSYGVGSLRLQRGEGPDPSGTIGHPSKLESNSLDVFFSNRTRDIDNGSRPPRQQFDADQREPAGISLNVGPLVRLAGAPASTERTMQYSIFGTRSPVKLNPMGDLLVGLGPSMGDSSSAAFIIAFTGFTSRPPG
jgi:hypothetical protein